MNSTILKLVEEYETAYNEWKNAELSEDAINAFKKRSEIANKLAVEMMKLIAK